MTSESNINMSSDDGDEVDTSCIKVRVYNRHLPDLEELLSNVERPGNFFVSGSQEVPMPKIEVEGVGILSFPVADFQVKQLIEQAVRAPYGRGEETILDVTVRKVWQLSPEKVRISGSTWTEQTLPNILSKVQDGLGCQSANVSVELYKMLIYDEGCFFKAHRDTEKTEGMFATLVVVLPSMHRGGELIVCHAGNTVAVNLSSFEVSELKFVAFYADCEHEVKPILEGNRVCIIYNLIQKYRYKKPLNQQLNTPLIAPMYHAEVTQAAEILNRGLAGTNTPIKLAWLLEHKYSPGALSFAALKNADKARANVLRQAALQANCTIHLAIVHIEESGSAEHDYNSYSRRRRWYHDDDDCSSEDFNIVEACEHEQFVDGWVNLNDECVSFGKIPMKEGELLPNKSLNDEPADKKRFTEATGNEGASYERSYHRAAVLIWRHDRYAEVLLQAGVGALIPYFEEWVKKSINDASEESQKTASDLANMIIERWEERLKSPSYAYGYHSSLGIARFPDMLKSLSQLNSKAALERFLSNIVIKQYDGTENLAILSAVKVLEVGFATTLLCDLVTTHIKHAFGPCLNILNSLTTEDGFSSNEWKNVQKKMANTIVTALKQIGTPVDSTIIVLLWNVLLALEENELRATAVAEIAARPTIFDPSVKLVAVLNELSQQHGNVILHDMDFRRLWEHTSQFLLSRSEKPPKPPQDWKQQVNIPCSCEDCQELKAFAENPTMEITHFKVRKDRRYHLHRMIDQHGVDMTHVTERTGSPLTLICKKTRQSYELRCKQYRDDLILMKTMISLIPGTLGFGSELLVRLASAVNHPKA